MNKLLILAAVVAACLAQGPPLPPPNEPGVQPVFPAPGAPIEPQPVEPQPAPGSQSVFPAPVETRPDENEPFFPAAEGPVDPRAVRLESSGSREEHRHFCNCELLATIPNHQRRRDSNSDSHERNCENFCFGRQRFSRALLSRVLRGIRNDGRDGGSSGRFRGRDDRRGRGRGRDSSSSSSESHSHEHGYHRRPHRPSYGKYRRPSYGYNYYPQQYYYPQYYYPSYGYGYSNQVRDIFQGSPIYGWQNYLSSPWAIPQYQQPRGGYY